jgi:pSer/pThr/pTyr-binding forkhead associated (FHA) protein
MGLFFSVDGTTINGTRVGKNRAQLKDGDILGFARYEFSFLFPESFYDTLKGSGS